MAALRMYDYARPVLDVGCGDGLVTSLVMKRVDIGCDPFSEAIGRAAGSGLYERIERRPVEAAHLPDGSLCTVLCNSVLEHVSSLRRRCGRYRGRWRQAAASFSPHLLPSSTGGLHCLPPVTPPGATGASYT